MLENLTELQVVRLKYVQHVGHRVVAVAGERGTIVHVFPGGSLYEVEFQATKKHEARVLSIWRDQIEVVEP